MVRFRILGLVASTLLWAVSVSVQAAPLQWLHSFGPGANNGRVPMAGLTLDGSTLYGTTTEGGSANLGAIYRINADGSGFQLIRSFHPTITQLSEPARPWAKLTQNGSTLYGTAFVGGNRGGGAVFRLNTDGTAFAIVYPFEDFRSSDGHFPLASVVLSGDSLYGTAAHDGSVDHGTLYTVNTNGTGFRVLHRFSGTEGFRPTSDLVLDGSTLYGTAGTGIHSTGVVFKFDLDGPGFEVLHNFVGPAQHDGLYPQGVILSGQTLYGVTTAGGPGFDGTVFKVNADGTGHELLHTFDRFDGEDPEASLLLSGNTLFGVTSLGGQHGKGTVFTLKTDGSNFRVLHDFAGGPLDGSGPYATLTLAGNLLVGTTRLGGAHDDGTVFALPVPEPTALALAITVFAVGGVARAARRK